MIPYRGWMATITPTPTLAAHESHHGTFPRLLFALNAACAWVGLLIGTYSSALGLYDYPHPDPNLLGNNSSALGRLIDTYSYFTILSVLLVAVIMTILAIKPSGHGRVFKVLRLDTLVMISVTGIIFWALLAGFYTPLGIDVISNVFDHTITPVVTIVVFLLVGPRNWIRWWIIPAAIVLPLVWVLYTLVRGSFIHAYPYGFLSVSNWGLPSVLKTTLFILLFGIFLGLIYWGIDALLGRRARASQALVDAASATHTHRAA